MAIEAKPFGDFLENPLPLTTDWIAESILPKRGVMILAGASKSYKSFCSLELCRALSLGENPFGHPEITCPEAAKVLLIEDEVKEWGLQKRGRRVFEGVSASYLNEKMAVLSGVPDIRLDTQKGFDIIKANIDKHEPNILMLDPMGRLIGSIDENRNDLIGNILNKLDRVLATYASTNLSLIMVLHSKKPDTRKDSNWDPLSPHAISGAGKWFRNPDAILMINKTASYRNTQGQKAARIAGRWEIRQGEGFDIDHTFTFNDLGDLKVRYVGTRGPAPKINVAPAAPPTPQQLVFTPG